MTKESGFYWARHKDDGKLTVIEIWPDGDTVTFLGNLNCPDLEEASDYVEILERIAEPQTATEPKEIGCGGDAINPEWPTPKYGKLVHDWRKYISDDLRAMWHTFTPEQRVAIAESADLTAQAEEWD